MIRSALPASPMRARLRLFSLLAAAAAGTLVVGADRTSRGSGASSFVHPGILVTRPQLDFVKAQIAAGSEPWASAFARAKADRHGASTYTAHPPSPQAATDTSPATTEPFVLCGSFSDPDVHCTDEKEDGVAAYTQALLWYFSGDDTYGRNAIAILNGWSILVDHRLSNASLEAAWMGTEFARAAEIMQLDSSWAAADVASFKAMMRRAFVPRLVSASPWNVQAGDPSKGTNGNWLLSVADSLIQIGVLLDDSDLFAQGVGLWRDRTPAYCYVAALDGAHPAFPCGGYNGSASGYASAATRTADAYGYWGQAGGNTPSAAAPADGGAAPSAWRMLADGTSQETCRDLEHVQYGLAAMMNGAETARIQGVDLYREQASRIAACMELAALYAGLAPRDASGNPLSYTTPVNPAVTVPGKDPSLCPSAAGKATVVLLNSGSLGSYVVQPTWEIGYNALANRLGMSMPNTQSLIATYRQPPAGWVGTTHHMGWETLTHGGVGSVGLGPTACGP